MAKTVKFSKMHGAGNDYIYVNALEYPIAKPEKAAIAWSANHTGIGSDGLVLIGRSDSADFSMRIFNADGSEAMMCGNATRCIGKYVFEKGLTDQEKITLETPSGIKVLKLHIAGNKVERVTVDMGEPSGIEDIDLGEEYGLKGTVLSIGNPHLVIFVPDITAIDLPVIGPKLEHHPLFPNRVNVEFVQVTGTNALRMRVWERGSGITLACGTGACASAVTAAVHGKAGRISDVVMDGGTLTIEWEESTNHVLMTGPATFVFEGEIEY